MDTPAALESDFNSYSDLTEGEQEARFAAGKTFINITWEKTQHFATLKAKAEGEVLNVHKLFGPLKRLHTEGKMAHENV